MAFTLYYVGITSYLHRGDVLRLFGEKIVKEKCRMIEREKVIS